MLSQLKENTLGLLSLKDFPLRSKENSFTKAFSFNCLKEKSVYKVTKDFPLTSKAGSHNSVVILYTCKFKLRLSCAISAQIERHS